VTTAGKGPGRKRGVLDGALDGIVSVDADGRVTEFNAAAERMFGYSRDEAMGMQAGEVLVPGDDRDEHWRAFRRAAEGRDLVLLGRRVELTARRTDGGRFPIELTITRTSADPPRFTGWIRDVSEQRAREAAERRRSKLMAQAEQMAAFGSWEWRLEPDEVMWSDNCYRIYGYRPGEIVPTVERVIAATHPDDRDRMARAIETLRERGVFPPIEFRIVRPDGAIHDLRARMIVLDKVGDGTTVVVGSVQDLTEQRSFEREINAHLAVAEALDEWQGFEGGARRLLSELGEALSFDVGALWLPEDEQLAARAFWQSDSLDLAEFERVTASVRVARGESVLGRAWESLEPQILPDLRDAGEFKRRRAAEAVGLRGAVVLPARDGDELMAMIEFYSRSEVVASDRLQRSLTGIANEIGNFLSRRRGEFAPVKLTPREREILQLAAKGHSGRSVAEKLVITPATVKTHFENIYAKLGVRDRATAVAEALRLGLIE
jgi:PAS domain S-box-containing protein